MSLSPAELTIDRLGAAGDGMAGGTAIPRSLPGERVLAESGTGKRARLLQILAESPDRITPPCPHFTAGCGGCALQHMADPAYAAWKTGRLQEALAQAGFPHAPIGALIRTPPGARRRMDFALRRSADGALVGLHEAAGQRIVDIAACPILHPALERLIAPLRTLANSLAALGRQGSALVNLLASGPDLLLRTDRDLESQDRTRLAAFAEAQGVARIAWALNDDAPQTAVQRGPVFMDFAGHRVEPPPGAFLQASPQGEAAIVAAILSALPEKLTRRSFAVELFAGIGTLSFPLADHLRVLAFEGDAAAATALRKAQAGTRVEATQRDLARQPLSRKELTGASLAVLDPPYAGVGAQMAALAASRLPVAYVSCNPVALARDAAVLARAGYAVRQATPIDQFLWSAQLEAVILFTPPA